MDGEPRTPLRIELLGRPRWSIGDHRAELRVDGAACLLASIALESWLTNDAVEALPSTDGQRDKWVQRLKDAVGREVFYARTRDLLPDVDIDLLRSWQEWPLGSDPTRVRLLHGVDADKFDPWLAKARECCNRLRKAAAAFRAADERFAAQDYGRAIAHADVAIACAPARWLAEAWLLKAESMYLHGNVLAAEEAAIEISACELLGSTLDLRIQQLRSALARGRAFQPPKLPLSLLKLPFTGRDRELMAMKAAWEAHSPFVLRGPSGIGKSRLLHAFLLRHGGAIEVHAQSGDDLAPFSTLGKLLQRATQMHDLRLSADIRRRLVGVLSAPPLGRATAPNDLVAVRQAARDLLVKVVDRKKNFQPVGIDDLHRADLPSLHVLRWLTQDGDLNGLLMFGFAMGPLAPQPQRDFFNAWIADSGGPVAIDLQPWTETDIDELLAHVVRPGAAVHATPRWLLDSTAGVPELVVYALQDLALRDPNEELAEPRPPRRSRESIAFQDRLRTVPRGAQPLIEIAAIMDAGLDVLARALACPQPEVDAMARQLDAHGIWVEGRLSEGMRAAVLAEMPRAAIQRWNMVAATVLQPDPQVPRARIAQHWRAAECWPEAATAYLTAGLHAEDLGQISEAGDLMRLAVSCFDSARDPGGEFDALCALGPIELRLDNREASCKLADRLHALAATPAQRARAAILDAQMVVRAYRPADDALAVAEMAMTAVQTIGDADLLAEAMTWLGTALAQAGRHAEAIDVAQRAWILAKGECNERRARDIGTNVVYVFWEASHLTEAIALAEELLRDYERVGDLYGIGAMQGNLAMLWLLSGNPVASIEPASSALKRHRELDRSALQSMAVVHRLGLARALAFEGRFEEALGHLHEGHRCIDVQVLPPIAAMVQLTLAHVLLLLGDEAAAVAALQTDESGWHMAMRVQRSWALARAASMRDDDAEPFLRRIGELFPADLRVPLAHAPWLEYGRLLTGDSDEFDRRLKQAQRRYADAGMSGVGRAALLRRIDRLNRVPGRRAIETAARLAREIGSLPGEGLHASTYLPEAWLIVAQALRRAGDVTNADTCVGAAARWVRVVALPNVPHDRRDAFLNRNAANRALGGSARLMSD